jgi:hypothetical protein
MLSIIKELFQYEGDRFVYINEKYKGKVDAVQFYNKETEVIKTIPVLEEKARIPDELL